MAEQNSVEEAIRTAVDARDFDGACTRALEAYGPEIMSFLVARLRSQGAGEEAFAMLAEDVWKGLPSFAFRCSARGWMYVLARNAANRYATSPHNRRDHNLPMTGQGAISALVERARTATQVYKRTEVKDRFRALREQLPEDDQTLLVLHIDRGLQWRELAMVMHEQGEMLEGEALERESAKLRKRFERMKSELRRLAIKDGLLKG